MRVMSKYISADEWDEEEEGMSYDSVIAQRSDFYYQIKN
jgi:hypothetical protein